MVGKRVLSLRSNISHRLSWDLRLYLILHPIQIFLFPQAHLHSHVGHDSPLVTFQCLQCNVGDLSFRLPQEHLAGGCQHFLVLPLDFHLQPK